MESLSRPGSPTAPEYTHSNLTPRASTGSTGRSPLSSPPLPRPGTPNPGGYVYAEGLDPTQDFQIIPHTPQDDAVAATVDSLSRMHLSPRQTSEEVIDLHTAVRNLDEVIASVHAMNTAYLGTKQNPDAEFFSSLLTSYEQTLALIQQEPLLITHRDKTTQDTCLHVGVQKIHATTTKTAPLICLFNVFLELGADREAINSKGQMPIELALELEMPILVDLLSGDAFNKETLLELACKHNHTELMQWLAKEPPAVMPNTARWDQAHTQNNNNNNNNDNNAQEPSKAALSDAMRLGNEITANPTDVYVRVKKMYETHKELLTARFKNSGDTVMHRAVRAFVAQHVLGIFELLVLIELRADKNARNYSNKTPLDLAKEANSMILVQLLEHPNPTIEVLTNLALEHGLETLTAWTLN